MKKILTILTFLVASGWTNAEAVDWNWNGDMFYRYEINDTEGLEHNRDSHRIRVRFGAYPWISEELSAGIQFATDGSNPRSRVVVLGDGFAAEDFMLNQAYIDIHPIGYGLDGKTSFTFGKRDIAESLITMNDLVWDADLTLEGISINYNRSGKNQLEGINAIAGYYVIDEDMSNASDPFFWVAQVAYTGKTESLAYTLGAGYYNYQGIGGNSTDIVGDWSTKFWGNTAISDKYAYDYDELELFANVSGAFGGRLPWQLYVQYVVNVAEEVDNDNQGYLLGATIGKAKKQGEWSLGANYSYLEKDAVLGAFTDATRFKGGTDGKGFEVAGSYMLIQNLALSMQYFCHEGENVAPSTEGSDSYDTFQTTLTLKF